MGNGIRSKSVSTSVRVVYASNQILVAVDCLRVSRLANWTRHALNLPSRFFCRVDGQLVKPDVDVQAGSTVEFFVQFGRKGSGDGQIVEVLRQIESHLLRLANHFDPLPPQIVDTNYVASRLGCTKEYISRLALHKEIPSQCILKGTGEGRPWKFYRSHIDRWIKQR